MSFSDSMYLLAYVHLFFSCENNYAYITYVHFHYIVIAETVRIQDFVTQRKQSTCVFN